MPRDARPEWVRCFKGLDEVDDPVGLSVVAQARQLHVPGETVVFRIGDMCESYLLVIDGSVRVRQTAANGREIILYRVGPGESCILTTSCLMGADAYAAEGITEGPVEAIAIPAPLFHRGVAESPAFRAFVFAGFGQRLADLMALVEEVAFGRLEARLAQRLLRFAQPDGIVALTHQELATEIGSAREVISRQLKDFERQGWVALHRGQIEILDPQALTRLTGMSAGVM